MSKAYLIAGLGLGDEGKGTVVDYLCARDKVDLVVRYNGGAQAGHNVVTNDGRHHTFAQFGSGTFQGVPTYLSGHMIVDPLALMKEGKHLEEVGVPNAFDLMAVDRECPVITPFHIIANLAREAARGDDRHGTCGLGVGETVEDWMAHPKSVPLVGDLEDTDVFKRKLKFIEQLKWEQMLHNRAYEEVARTVNIDELVYKYGEFMFKVGTVDRDFIRKAHYRDSTVVFEGAQGVLLDQDFGFQPHTTWSNVTFDNAYEMLSENFMPGPVTRIGVTRTVTTRHGEGPLPTALPDHADRDMEKHNRSDNEQGKFRTGILDFVLMRYAINVLRGVDEIAMTHLDMGYNWNVCNKYLLPDEAVEFFDTPGSLKVNRPADYDYQCRLTEMLTGLDHGCAQVQGVLRDDFMDFVKQETTVPVTITSRGPRACDKNKPPFEN